jgi:hypothetical protein
MLEQLIFKKGGGRGVGGGITKLQLKWKMVKRKEGGS